jgi:cation diffusion facilitator CzcD-associated flavoprotein CzcO
MQQNSTIGKESLAQKGSQYFETVIIGTGFSGLLAAIRLKKKKFNDFVLLERSSDIGGTWRDNSYP